jgi:Tfp pilus assembly protein PilZ
MRISILIVARDPRTTLGLAHAMLKFGYQILTAFPDEVELDRVEGAIPSAVVVRPPTDPAERTICLRLMKKHFLDRAIPVAACVETQDEARAVKDTLGDVTVLTGKPLQFNELYGHIQEMLDLARRRELRITTELVVAHREPDDLASHYYDTMSSLSMGGCFIRTESPYPMGDGIELLFCVGGGSDSLTIRGKIRRHGASVEPGMGVEFDDLSDDDRARLESFILSHLGTADLPSDL